MEYKLNMDLERERCIILDYLFLATVMLCGIIAARRHCRGLQEGAARIIVGGDLESATQSLKQRRYSHKCILMYKCLHQEGEGVDIDILRHIDNTRRKEDFLLPCKA